MNERFRSGWTVTDVIDTREYELVGDYRKAVPGSGDPEPCACCGRSLVIHVHLTRGNERAIVGQACAKKLNHTIAQATKNMPARGVSALVDDLIGIGLERDKAIGVAHRATIAVERGTPVWFATYGHITREQMAAIFRNHPKDRLRHERIVAAFARRGITCPSLIVS